MDIKLKFAVMALLVSVVICLATVLALVLTMPDLPTAMGHDQICLPNEDGYFKCGFAADLLHEYVERIAAKTYDEIEIKEQCKMRESCKQTKKQWGKMKPAAKLTGKKQSGTLNKNDIDPEMIPVRENVKTKQSTTLADDTGSDMTLVREWCHGKELRRTGGFQGNGIGYRNGHLVVPVDGTYFVHSFVELLEPCDPLTGKPNVKDTTKPIKHSIFKFKILDKEDIELVSNIQSRTVSQSKYFNLYNSYVSSLVELKAGDEISVKISNITYLKYTRDNYFGVSLIYLVIALHLVITIYQTEGWVRGGGVTCSLW
ncbi:uncharacterized protein LOC123554574 [Mercenaria mercenaria]|uniref:uncharacterized protein LOC123554574 n=1 Tax=Mercenaria mercenaria TaxID=6596 RepID=UPI00234F3E6A|nr:uncharacterized protein LOC123554574 [Mercenaria mercenaria]